MGSAAQHLNQTPSHHAGSTVTSHQSREEVLRCLRSPTQSEVRCTEEPKSNVVAARCRFRTASPSSTEPHVLYWRPGLQPIECLGESLYIHIQSPGPESLLFQSLCHHDQPPPGLSRCVVWRNRTGPPEVLPPSFCTCSYFHHQKGASTCVTTITEAVRLRQYDYHKSTHSLRMNYR